VKNLSLNIKIALLLVVMLGALLTVGGVGLVQMNAINTRLANLVDNNSAAARQAMDLRIEITGAVRNERQSLLATSIKSATEFADAARKSHPLINARIDELENTLDRLGHRELDDDLKDVRRDWEALEKVQIQVLDLAVKKTVLMGSQKLYGEYYPITVAAADPLRELGPKYPAAFDARAKMFRVGFMLADHLQTLAAADVEKIDEQVAVEADKLRGYLADLNEKVSAEDKARYGRTFEELAKLLPLQDEIRKLSIENTDNVATEMTRTLTTEKLYALNGEKGSLPGLIGQLTQLQEQDRNAADQGYQAGKWIVIVSALIGTVLAGLLAWLLARSITSPIKQSIGLFESVSKGDLTRRLQLNRADEIGRLGKSTDAMADALAKTVAAIRGLSGSVDKSAVELSTVSHELLSQSQQMSSQSESVASSTEEMSTNINTMAAAAEEMSTNVASISSASEEVSVNTGTISGAAEQMSRSIAHVSESMTQITGTLQQVARDAREESQMTDRAAIMARDAGTTIQQLEHAASEINKVSEVIKTIALQTNLLALNATIEATSAGEAGKGFAVVAGEIKELALQSGQSAEDIARKIESVQASTRQAVKAIEGITALVNNINQSAGRISEAVELQTKAADQISGEVSQTRKGIENVARSIAEVAKGTTDMSSSTAEVSRAATDVSRNAAEAAKASGLIASNIHGVSDATRHNNQNAIKVNEAARKLAEVAQQLKASVARFKLEDESAA
jgi:methyl-accepting chemotaxis protein